LPKQILALQRKLHILL